MKQPIIPMSFEAFDVMERPFGWKVEYWDGCARLTPRSVGVKTTINLVPRQLAPHHYTLIPVSPDDRDRLLAGYFESFSASVEFCGWPPESIHESAARNIGKYFSGTKGEPLSASVIALAPGCPDVVGVALFIDRPEKGAYLDLLYVRTDFQRQGVATAMLNWAIDRLIKSGFKTLASTYHVCNEPSRLWHHGHGFVDQYDGYYARLKMSWYQAEIWRRETLGLTDGLGEMKQACDRWASQISADWDAFY